ncbi:MAG: undecaprenyl-diphosphate phosphatase [Pseudomonadota bacterium]
MTWLQLFLIAVLQGITEFLPISSSGHLILLPQLTGMPDQGLAIDVAVHVATLAAIIVYFLRDVTALTRGGLASLGLVRQRHGGERRWFWYLVAGTVPAVIVGAAFTALDLSAQFRATHVVATNLIVYGLILWVADRWGRETRAFEDMTLKDALLVGAAQALALVPGTSRSGVTMTMARFLGFARPEAARFSFLLSIPAVAGAGLLVGKDLLEAGAAYQHDALIAGIMTFFAALAAMAFLMRWLRHASMTIFVIYRLALGLALFAFA